MSLKAVELQIAIPKTFDAGKQQSEIQLQLHAKQDMANEALKQQIEKNHTLLSETAEQKKLRQDEEKNNKFEHSAKKHKKQEEEEKLENQAKHPFKGSLFDYSG